ncbi:MAG TPA: hypothetical protein VLW83_13860 [Candidatus Acidoferrales bacterium]|nr:hypothetical protein [Candidatus Acidoferrales bacterium]
MNTAPTPRGFTALGVFCFFGASMALLAAVTLLFPGTPLDRAWKLNPRAYRELSPLGATVGVPFLLLAVCMLFTGVGWLRRRPWAWWLAAVGLAIQVCANVVNLFLGRFVEGITGVTIAGALFLYIVSSKVRAVFRS